MKHKSKNHRRGLKRYYSIEKDHDTNINDEHQMYKSNRYNSKSDNWDFVSTVNLIKQRPQYVENDLPPYLKKYNKRNKQLLNLMEGTVSPITYVDYISSAKFRSPQKHNHKKNKWMETNLFEEQRPIQNNRNQTNLSSNNSSFVNNALPGENDRIEDTSIELIENSFSPISGKVQKFTLSATQSVPSKTDHFTYHRVASPKLVGAGSYGLLRKQRLPFVAITDKRLGRPSSNRAYVQ